MAEENIPKAGDPDYWKKMKELGKKTLGRPKKIESPEQLWQYACEYFEEVDNNPHKHEDFIRAGDKAGNKVHLKNIKPYTWAGLDGMLFRRGIIVKTEDYRLNRGGKYSDFSGVIAHIDSIMWNQKFTGASVGAFKENIIARDLKLKETNDVQVDSVKEVKVTISRRENKNDVTGEKP